VILENGALRSRCWTSWSMNGLRAMRPRKVPRDASLCLPHARRLDGRSASRLERGQTPRNPGMAVVQELFIYR